jgi:hypothetical protein
MGLSAYNMLSRVYSFRVGRLSVQGRYHNPNQEVSCQLQSRARKEIKSTDVANEPVLQTVNTFRPSPEPPLAFTSWTSQSPPHLAIALLRPTSSAATCLPSRIKSSAIARGSFPASREVWSVRARRRVAAPRLTAVGRAVNKKSRIGDTCALRLSGEERYSGGVWARRDRERCCETLRAAREAMAGAPRICYRRSTFYMLRAGRGLTFIVFIASCACSMESIVSHSVVCGRMS